MSFVERVIPVSHTISIPQRRAFSSILAEYPWASSGMIASPALLTHNVDKLAHYKMFIDSLQRFENELFQFNIDNEYLWLLRLLGIVLPQDQGHGHADRIVARHDDTLTVQDYHKIASVIAAYRFYEIISLRAGVIARLPANLPRVRMFLPPVGRASAEMKTYRYLHCWPSLLDKFRKVADKATPRAIPPKHYSIPMMSLVKMVDQSASTAEYAAISENLLLAALHISLLKNIPSRSGSLPDSPSIYLPSYHQGPSEYGDFVQAYTELIQNYKTDTVSNTTPVGLRNAFYLAVTISPLFLLVPVRLSKKSFNRYLTTDISAQLGPDKPDSLECVENLIWDTVDRLSNGNCDIYEEIMRLVSVLPLPLIDAARNSPTEGSWFKYMDRCLSTVHDLVDASAVAPIASTSNVAASGPSTLPNLANMSAFDPPVIPNFLSNLSFLSPYASARFSPLYNMSHLGVPPAPIPVYFGPPRLCEGSVDDPASMRMDIDSNRPLASSTTDNSIPVGGPSPLVPAGAGNELVNPQSRINTIPSTGQNENNGFGDASSFSGSPNARVEEDFNEVRGRRDSTPSALGAVPGFEHVEQGVGSSAPKPIFYPSDYNFPEDDFSNPFDYDHDFGPNHGDENTDHKSSSGSSPPHPSSDPRQSDGLPAPPETAPNDTNTVDVPSPKANISTVPSNTSKVDDTSSDVPSIVEPEPRRRSARNKKSVKSTEIVPDDLDEEDGEDQLNGGGHNDDDDGGHNDDADGGKESVNEIDNTDAQKVDNPLKRRATSPPSSSLLGTAENPICIDTVASIFDTPSYEFAEIEAVSLSRKKVTQKSTPRIYNIYDSAGAPVKFSPRFHYLSYHRHFEGFMDYVAANDKDGKPLFIRNPESSIIAVMTFEAFSSLSSKERQELLAKKNVVVSGWPTDETVSFNEEGLAKYVGNPYRQISIQDYTMSPTAPDGITVCGLAKEIWDNRGPDGKILNALDLPMFEADTKPTEYSTDLHAWGEVRSSHRVHHKEQYPTEEMRWALVGLKNAMTYVHADCDGLGTFIQVLCGGKIWGFVRPLASNPLGSINFFLHHEFALDEMTSESPYELEAIALKPRDRLFMLPGQPHFVYGYEDTICTGGHYYFTHQMQRTFYGLIHTFMLQDFLTNTTHPTRPFIRRMVIFYHMAFIDRKITPGEGLASHLPRIDTASGLLDLICACTLVIFGNVLDHRTYESGAPSAPSNPSNDDQTPVRDILLDTDVNIILVGERFANCYARGVALRILEWIRSCAIVRNREEIVPDFPTYFLHKTHITLKAYYDAITESGLMAQTPFSDAPDFFLDQLNNIRAIFKPSWAIPQQVDDRYLGIQDIDNYSVEWSSERDTWNKGDIDFVAAGTTPLDRRFFKARKDRRRYEEDYILQRIQEADDWVPPTKRAKTEG